MWAIKLICWNCSGLTTTLVTWIETVPGLIIYVDGDGATAQLRPFVVSSFRHQRSLAPADAARSSDEKRRGVPPDTAPSGEVKEAHTSCSSRSDGPMKLRREGIGMGVGKGSEFGQWRVGEEEMRRLRRLPDETEVPAARE